MAYVINQSGIVPFNLVRHTASPPITEPGWNGQTAFAIGPNGKTGYTTTDKGLVPVDLVTGTFGKAIPTKGYWQSLAVSPDGKTIYLAGGRDFTSITSVNTVTGAMGRSIPVSGKPAGLALSPNGLTAYVVTQGGATLTPVTLASGTIGESISVPEGVSGLAISRDGTMAYATGATGESIGNQEFAFLTPINLRTNTAGTPIPLVNQPYGIVLSGDERTAFVTGGNPGSGPPIPPDLTSVNLANGHVTHTYSIRGGAYDIVGQT